MSKIERIMEDILIDAVDTYVAENREDMVRDIRKLTAEEGKTLPQALEAVVRDWLENGDGYFFIKDDMHRQIEQSCEYEYDCEKIIFEYGFTNSLEAAKENGVRLSNTDEFEVAVVILRISIPEKQEIREEVEAHLCSTDAYQKLAAEVQECSSAGSGPAEKKRSGNSRGGDA